MKSSRIAAAIATVAVAFVVSCTDRMTPTAPGRGARDRIGSLTSGACLSYTDLQALTTTVFGAGSPNVNSALGKLSNIKKQLDKGATGAAQANATDLIAFIQQKASQLANPALVQSLINNIECFSGLSTDTFLVYPSDQQQTIINGSGQAGLRLPPNPVTEPTLITVTSLDPNGPSPLITKLDQYPGYVSVTQQSGVTNSLTGPVTVAVCPAAGIPDSIRTRLRLGHQATAGFEVTPPADGSFLNCTAVVSNESGVSRFLNALVSLVTPKPLYAKLLGSGGVGGSAGEFSPFGPVDPVLSFGGGVGGSAGEFLVTPTGRDSAATRDAKSARDAKDARTSPPSGRTKAPDPAAQRGLGARAMSSVMAANVADPCSEGIVSTPVPFGCRPNVTLTTARGTVFQNVPVTFAIGQGGGSTAAINPATLTCGAFGAVASSTTNAVGVTNACWTLGAVAGINTLTATPSVGGDAPAGVTFSPPLNTYTVNALKAAATLTLSGTTQVYDGSPKSVTVTTAPADLVTVTVTYDGSSTPPPNAGSYAVVATLSNPSWQGSANGTLTISQAVQSALGVTSPSTTGVYNTTLALGTSGGNGTGGVTYDVGTSTACTVSGSTLSITRGTGSCSVTATKAGDTNYGPITSPAFTITVQKAAASLALGNLNPTYDGNPKSPSVTTTPAGLAVVSVIWSTVASPPTNAGSYPFTASLANADYAAADAPGTLVIAKANQAPLTMSGATTATYGSGAVSLNASGGSGTGVVSFATSTPFACSVNTTTGATTALTGVGSCTVTATKAADGNYNATTSAAYVVTLAMASQTITFGALGNKNYGDPAFGVGATASSALPVSFSAAPAATCSVSGTTVTIGAAGTCTVTATQAGDASFYNAAPPASQSFTVARRAATATSGSATINFGAAVPTISCTVTGLLAADAGSVTCTTSVASITAAGSYPAVPVTSPANPANYAMSLVNGTLTVAPYTQVGCFSSPIYSSQPPSKSYQRKGSNLPIKCTLTTPQGAGVLTATGNLVVQDRGTDGNATPTVAFAGTNVFRVSGSGNYAYGLDTGLPTFVTLHYFYVIATWNDGSTTTGWFYIK